MTKAKRLSMTNSLEKSFDPLAAAKLRASRYNRVPGQLTGYDCPKCLNRGQTMVVHDDGTTAVRPCECMAIRNSLRRIERSGMKELVERCSLENYEAVEPWQKRAKELALEYIAAPAGHWFFLSGQPGSGKTHLCTAICKELMFLGTETLYTVWPNTVQRLSAIVTLPDEYEKAMKELITVPLLYLDDFLKVGGGQRPTTGDLKRAFEVLNMRYLNPQLLTIISTERTIPSILKLDEALGSRIKERCGKYELTFSGIEKNRRLQKKD